MKPAPAHDKLAKDGSGRLLFMSRVWHDSPLTTTLTVYAFSKIPDRVGLATIANRRWVVLREKYARDDYRALDAQRVLETMCNLAAMKLGCDWVLTNSWPRREA